MLDLTTRRSATESLTLDPSLVKKRNHNYPVTNFNRITGHHGSELDRFGTLANAAYPGVVDANLDGTCTGFVKIGVKTTLRYEAFLTGSLTCPIRTRAVPLDLLPDTVMATLLLSTLRL